MPSIVCKIEILIMEVPITALSALDAKIASRWPNSRPISAPDPRFASRLVTLPQDQIEHKSLK
jgi:hypothetical protein